MADSRRANLSAIARRKAWTAATRRRNEIINIAKHRSAQGVSLDQGAFIFGIAQTLASARKGKYRIKSRFVTYHGLDSASLARSVYEAGFGRLGCDDDLIERTIARVEPGPAMSSDTAGRLLKLTAEERDLLSIRTIEAIDASTLSSSSISSASKLTRLRPSPRRSSIARSSDPASSSAAVSLSSVTPRCSHRRSRRIAAIVSRSTSFLAVSSASTARSHSVSKPIER